MGGAQASAAAPTRIDGGWMPRAHRWVVDVDVAGQQVLYDRRTGALHGLNDTAALIWSCCDGSITVDELVDELSAACGAPAAEVRGGVHEVVAQLAAADLLDPVGSAGADVDAEFETERRPPRSIRPPCAPCLAKLNSIGWAGSVAVLVGDAPIGVRASTSGGVAIITELLAGSVVDGPAPLHYSVVIGALGNDRGVRELHRLYFGDQLLVRTRSTRRVLRALVAHLDGHLDATRTDRLLVGGPVFVRDDRAVLVAAEHEKALELAEPQLRRLGVSRWDGPSVALDGPGRVVLTSPSLEVDARALDALDEPVDAAGREQPAPGVHTLSGWLVAPGTGPVVGPHALAAMAPSVRNLDAFGPVASLELLAAQVDKVTFDSTTYAAPAALAAAVDRLLG